MLLSHEAWSPNCISTVISRWRVRYCRSLIRLITGCYAILSKCLQPSIWHIKYNDDRCCRSFTSSSGQFEGDHNHVTDGTLFPVYQTDLSLEALKWNNQFPSLFYHLLSFRQNRSMLPHDIQGFTLNDSSAHNVVYLVKQCTDWNLSEFRRWKHCKSVKCVKLSLVFTSVFCAISADSDLRVDSDVNSWCKVFSYSIPAQTSAISRIMCLSIDICSETDPWGK